MYMADNVMERYRSIIRAWKVERRMSCSHSSAAFGWLYEPRQEAHLFLFRKTIVTLMQSSICVRRE